MFDADSLILMVASSEPLLEPTERKKARFIDRKGTDERSNGPFLLEQFTMARDV